MRTNNALNPKMLEEILKSLNDTIVLETSNHEIVYHNGKNLSSSKMTPAKEEVITVNGANYCLKIYSNTDEKGLLIRDSFTGFLTKNAFYDEIPAIEERLWLEKKRAITVFADIDNLKKLNNTYGHIGADTLLKDATRVMKENIRASDIAVRFGGDEFLFLMENMSLRKGYYRVKLIQQEINKLKQFLPRINTDKLEPVHISCSFGMAMTEADPNIKKTLQKADEALYLSKKRGKNRIHYFSPKKEKN